MDSVDGKGHLPVGKSSSLEVEPALGVPLVVSALCVAGRPQIVVIVGSFDDSGHIA